MPFLPLTSYHYHRDKHDGCKISIVKFGFSIAFSQELLNDLKWQIGHCIGLDIGTESDFGKLHLFPDRNGWSIMGAKTEDRRYAVIRIGKTNKAYEFLPSPPDIYKSTKAKHQILPDGTLEITIPWIANFQSHNMKTKSIISPSLQSIRGGERFI